MTDSVQLARKRRRFGLAAATFTGLSYFALLVIGALDPKLLQQPVADGRHLSVGLVAGSALIILIVVCGAIYTGMGETKGDTGS